MNAAGGPRVSVIVPAIDEADEIEASLHSAGPQAREIIVVDGGSRDDTITRARGCGARVVTSPAGRARQMNRGAAEARGDVLLFLHADTRLPPDWAEAVDGAVSRDAIGGRFDVVLRGRHPLLRVVAALMNLRSRWTQIHTGDQAIFVRRDVFERLGGYAPIPLMEDIELCRRLKREGRLVCLRAKVSTSGRRWETQGVWRTIFLMWWIRLAYALGASPSRLARMYRSP